MVARPSDSRGDPGKCIVKDSRQTRLLAFGLVLAVPVGLKSKCLPLAVKRRQIEAPLVVELAALSGVLKPRRGVTGRRSCAILGRVFCASGLLNLRTERERHPAIEHHFATRPGHAVKLTHPAA